MGTRFEITGPALEVSCLCPRKPSLPPCPRCPGGFRKGPQVARVEGHPLGFCPKLGRTCAIVHMPGSRTQVIGGTSRGSVSLPPPAMWPVHVSPATWALAPLSVPCGGPMAAHTGSFLSAERLRAWTPAFLHSEYCCWARPDPAHHTNLIHQRSFNTEVPLSPLSLSTLQPGGQAPCCWELQKLGRRKEIPREG